MSDWLHNLPILWMALVIFSFTSLITVATYFAVKWLARGERARSFKAVSSAMLSPLGIIFGLFVAFTAAQVWSDTDRANAAVIREASALRSIVVLANSFPGEPEARIRASIRSYIEEAATKEWPMMAQQTATWGLTPASLANVLKLDLALTPAGSGEQLAQREMAVAVENALDARRQRILVSRAEVNGVKWVCLLIQAVCVLGTIAVVHTGDRLASAISLGIYAAGVAACILLIAAHDRPFTGHISVSPAPLLQVMPRADDTAAAGEAVP